jgi:hypothetical protein
MKCELHIFSILEVRMYKNKLARLSFIAFNFLILTIGCNSGSSTSSSSGSNTTPSQEVPAHSQATVNLLERSPFKGKDLDPVFWTNMEAYCKAGPTQLIIADMNLVPVQMGRAGFSARWAAQCYALASTYAGYSWSRPTNDEESQMLWDVRDQIDAWWSRYIQKIVEIMQKAPQTTAVIIINDGGDRLGERLGAATLRNMASVRNRVTLGSVIPL